MKELDKLRELAADINSTEIIDHLDVVGRFMFHCEWLDSWHKAFDAACDAIEQAIAERYMELPLDADGKPWHIGDRTESDDCVRAIGHKTIVYDFAENDCDWAHTRTHEKPDTIEDVLRGLVALAEDTSGGRLDDGDIEGFADEIRRLVRDERVHRMD